MIAKSILRQSILLIRITSKIAFFYVIKKSCFRQKCFLGYYQYS